MTRQEQLKLCKTCLKRRFSTKKGVVCSLTDEKADFDVICKDYDRDENVIVQEPVIEVKRKRKEKRKKTKREKVREVITRDDLFLILGFVLANVLIIRIILYFSLGYISTRNFIIFLVLTLLSISLALLFRDKKVKAYRFFGNLKFKLLYTLIFTFVHILFVLFTKSVDYIDLGKLVFINLSFVLIVSMLSYIVVKPIHLFRGRKLNRNEKIS